MTNYNDGKWHGWNGGECPVHPKTEVHIATLPPAGGEGIDYADQFVWDRPDHLGNPIIAFRVVKEYREPREFWITIYDGLAWDDEIQAAIHNETLGDNAGHITHVLEVLPD